ncbi:hypothetical protein KP509_22G012900 [Ceratopteris richardii]|uniref:Major facilitator superfamily (MFS) profile domain-containing protein n=1 Tax=Ceratopteris richardii TaxID=49495 RepID=A0A8T2S5F2_CERRI|nr:hypothetical protein KP509_22G012900 [Ceratopteris richardii]
MMNFLRNDFVQEQRRESGDHEMGTVDERITRKISDRPLSVRFDEEGGSPHQKAKETTRDRTSKGEAPYPQSDHAQSESVEGAGLGDEFVSIDEVFSKWVGSFGRAQKIHFAVTSFAWSLEALHTLVPIFADKTPAWRCARDATTSHLPVLRTSSSLASCSSSTSSPWSSAVCKLSPFAWEWVRKDESTISEWNLVCSRSYMQGLTQSCFFIGSFLGAGLFGHLSDSRLGRRGALILACLVNAVCGMLTAASPSYGVYMLMRTLTGICSGGLGLTSFVLCTELIGPSHRAAASMSSLYFYPLGTLLLVALSAANSHSSWRILYVITSAPSVIYGLFILPFLIESPRWYLVRGRTNEALKVLRSVAKRNKTVLPEGIILRMDVGKEEVGHGYDVKDCDVHTNSSDRGHSVDDNEYNKAAGGTLIDVFRNAETRKRIVILVMVWFATAMGYYAFNLNVGNLGTNLAMSVVLNAIAEVPGYGITTCVLNRFGRRNTLVVVLLLTACSSLAGAVISLEIMHSPHAHRLNHLRGSIQLACGLVGLLSIAGAYNLLYLYTTELFPTIVRNAALGMATQAGAVGSIIAPMVVVSAHVNTTIPFFAIGGISLLSGMMAIMLPETLNTPFHETLESMQTENLQDASSITKINRLPSADANG